MAEIGSYSNATTPLAGTERLVGDEGGVTRDVTPEQISQFAQGEIAAGLAAATAAAVASATSAAAASAAAAAAAVATPIVSTSQVIGRGVAPVTGTSASAGTYVWADPIEITGTLAQLQVFSPSSGTINLALYTLSGQTLTRVGSAVAITVASGLNTLTPANFGTINVAAGQYIGITNPFTFVGSPTDGAGWWGIGAGAPGSGTAGTPSASFQLQAGFTISGSVPITAQNQPSQLTLANVDRIFTVSNSFYEGDFLLKGKTITQILSALTEYNFANWSKSGQTIAQLVASIAGGVNPLGGFGVHGGLARYLMWSENVNSKGAGETDAVYASNYQGAINVTKAIGATALIVTEYGGTNVISVDGEEDNVKLLRNIADQNDVPFIDVTSKSRAMNTAQFAGFWGGIHPGTRNVYLLIDPLRKGMKQVLPRPLRSMKIFRVRGTVTVSGVSSLSFRTIAQRHQLFKELYLAANVLADSVSNGYDSLNTVVDTTQPIADEYAQLATGASVSLGNWVLIDCVLPVNGTSGITLTLSDPTISVFARQLNSDNTISWLPLSVLNGVYVVPENQGVVDGDRIAFALNKGGGGISLSASPIVAWAAGRARTPQPAGKLYPPKGTEMLTQPLTVVSSAIPVQWTNTGSLAISTPTDATYPTGCTGSVDVTSANGLSQTFTYPASDDPVEIVVRVWARNWVSIYSSSGATPPNGPITYETCDTGTLLCTLSGSSAITHASASLVEQVGLAWTEVEWRETLPANPTGTMTVVIDVRSQDVNLAVAKVSVRAAF